MGLFVDHLMVGSGVPIIRCSPEHLRQGNGVKVFATRVIGLNLIRPVASVIKRCSGVRVDQGVFGRGRYLRSSMVVGCGCHFLNNYVGLLMDRVQFGELPVRCRPASPC